MAITEESPLITHTAATGSLRESQFVNKTTESLDLKREGVYERFTPGKKKVVLSIVSWCCLMPLFVSGSIYPCIPQMVEDFHSTPKVIGLAVSISVLSSSIGAFTAASYSTFYGRKPIYLCALPILVLGSLGVSLSRTVPELLFYRAWQALGSSPGFSIGAGVIGDIYKLEERGTAMGIFLAAVLLGPSIAPVAGGLAVKYASWRFMQFLIGIFGLFAFMIVWIFLPETSQPGARGLDKLRNKHRNSITQANWTNYIVNPFSPLALLRAPNILAVTLGCFGIVQTFFVLTVPLAYTIGARYRIVNEALVGALCIPGGIGEVIGAPLSGWISDRVVIQWRKRRGGEWYPEDRLRATLSGALIFVPMSMILSGLVTTYIPNRVGLYLNFICLFMNGFGLELVLSPAAAYVVDVLHSRSAEAMAVNNGFRSMILSVAIASIMPMIDGYGLLVTNTLSATLAWVGFGLFWLTIRYGESMRSGCNVVFSTAQTN